MLKPRAERVEKGSTRMTDKRRLLRTLFMVSKVATVDVDTLPNDIGRELRGSFGS